MNVRKDLKILIVVDDEPDILDTLENLLSMYVVVKAKTFDEAKGQLETQPFDIAILDIMGVNGYELPRIAAANEVAAVMFTAHALTPGDTIRSLSGGAACYVPKDKMAEMPEILANILKQKQKGQSTWTIFMDWADAYNSIKFGPGHDKHRKELQERLR